MANEVVVGFIGLGTMGGKMATNILKAGYKVVVHDLHRQSAGSGSEEKITSDFSASARGVSAHSAPACK